VSFNCPFFLSASLQVRGEIHHDRRLHQLMLQEEINQARGPAQLPAACLTVMASSSSARVWGSL
jgi:hypothetical protein